MYRSHDLPKTELLSLEKFLRKKKFKSHYVIEDFNVDVLEQDNPSLEFHNHLLEKEYTPYFTDKTSLSENYVTVTSIDNICIKNDMNNIKSYELT